MTEQLSKRVNRTRNKALANPGLVHLNINIHVNVDYVDVSIVSIVSMWMCPHAQICLELLFFFFFFRFRWGPSFCLALPCLAWMDGYTHCSVCVCGRANVLFTFFVYGHRLVQPFPGLNRLAWTHKDAHQPTDQKKNKNLLITHSPFTIIYTTQLQDQREWALHFSNYHSQLRVRSIPYRRIPSKKKRRA